MSEQDRFYITTAIDYPNSRPHIGTAFEKIGADVQARFRRMEGASVHFLMGNDENTNKVTLRARELGLDPKAYVDDMARQFQEVWTALEISNNDFIQTSEERHHRGCQKFIQAVYDGGDIYKGVYAGHYCTGCESFKTEKEVAEAGGKCPNHPNTPLSWVEEENYYFRLSAYRDRLLAFYAENPDFIQPESARNEVLQFVRQGLDDLSISRSTFDWGIPIPWDPKHVIYVWVDALLNYATAVGYGADQAKFEETFPANVHLVGKDILRFHAVIWPAMLMANGLPLPGKVAANGWLMVGGEKMSKSNLTGISPQQLTEHFGVDAYRWYFLRAIHFGQDGSFSWEDFTARYTSELANDFGNLASRVAAMVGKYFGGTLPEATAVGDAERAIADGLATAAAEADARIGDRLDFAGGIAAVFEFIKQVNGYLTEQEPWKVAKATSDEAQARLATILYTAAESLRAVAVLLNPVMPGTCEKLWASLGAAAHLGPLAGQRVQDSGAWGLLPAGAEVTKGEALFPRLEEPKGA